MVVGLPYDTPTKVVRSSFTEESTYLAAVSPPTLLNFSISYAVTY